jgi:flagellar protein FliO/FliZ
MAAEFSAKLQPETDLRPANLAPAQEPSAAAPPPPVSPPQTDRNLAEMAQRLEAALRRPSLNDMHPPVTDPLAAPIAPRQTEQARNAKPEPKPEFKPEPKSDTKSAQTKNPFDSLEEEMASLLGRQPGKT